MGAPERRRRDRDKRREAFLCAAKRLFDEKGYEATTIDDIVAAVELTKGAFYHHFSSKQEIVGLLQLRNIELLEARFAEAIKDVADPGEQLAQLGRTFVKYIQENLRPNRSLYFFLDSYRIADLPPELRAQTMAHYRRLFAFIHNAIEKGKQRGLFRPDLDATLLTLAFWGTASGIHAISVKLRELMPQADAQRISEEYLKTIPYGMVRAVARPS
jgi:AcrR family transcriptional regulator